MKILFRKLTVAGMLLVNASMAAGMDGDVRIEEKAGSGKYLTDSRGMTLYWHVKDAAGKSMCSDACLERWPIFYRETVVAPNGLTAKDFVEIKREDGIKQTTFRGYPLYYNANDVEPGDINRQKGNNILGLIVDPDNFPPKQSSDKK